MPTNATAPGAGAPASSISIIPARRFRLVQSENNALASYTFKTHTARHYFCKTCGYRPFYIPRFNPGGNSVNDRCLDEQHIKDVTARPFDGKQWENSARAVAHLSK